MAYNADINDLTWEELFRIGRHSNKEKHTYRECNFGKTEWYRICGTGREHIIVYRICRCKLKTTKDNRIKKTMHITEFGDGLEIHTSQECCYIQRHLPDNTFELSKLCYCPKDCY